MLDASLHSDWDHTMQVFNCSFLHQLFIVMIQCDHYNTLLQVRFALVLPTNALRMFFLDETGLNRVSVQRKVNCVPDVIVSQGQ